jgi:hypothetical protein
MRLFMQVPPSDDRRELRDARGEWGSRWLWDRLLRRFEPGALLPPRRDLSEGELTIQRRDGISAEPNVGSLTSTASSITPHRD